MSDVDKKEVAETPEESPVEVEKASEEVKEVKEIENASKEKEEDAPSDLGERYRGVMQLSTVDSTLNCVVSDVNVVDALPIEGANFVGATRANFGLTGGRYLYEVEIIAIRGTAGKVQVGFSCTGSSLFLSEKDTLCFNNDGAYFADGKKVSTFRGRRFSKDDIVGVLLNCSTSGHSRTISLFINGIRSGEPQPIPESFDGALFPHITTKMALVSVNLSKKIRKKLPFEVRMVGDANSDDVTPSDMKEVPESKVMVPMGMDCADYIQTYIDSNADQNFVQVTHASIAKWQEKSGLTKKPLENDALRWLERMMAMRKRNYIYSVGHNLLAADRTTLAQRFPAFMKKVLVVCPAIIEKLRFTMSFCKDVTLPTADEGFTVEHTDGENMSKSALESWQKKCKLHTLVSDLKPGESFMENMAKWVKLRDVTRTAAEKKKKQAIEDERKALALANGEEVKEDDEKEEKEKEEKEKEEKTEEGEKEDKVLPSDVDCMDFSDEDWMLADLRIEIHFLIHAFREDVEDKDRVSFSADHLQHYYKLYNANKKHFSLQAWGAKTVAECLEVVNDTVDVEDGMVVAKHDRAVSLDFLLQQSEEARQHRSDRIGAGDEGAQLKFKAPRRALPAGKGARRPNPPQKSQSYTNRGGKGQGLGRFTQPPPRSQSSMASKGFSSQREDIKRKPSASEYQMRPIPQAGSASFKRPQGASFQQSLAKRR